MATNHTRFPQRRTAAQRVKLDENAMGKLPRHVSNFALGSRHNAKENVVGSKPSYPRQALGEVTIAAVNRKENIIKVAPIKEKDETGLKRGRSNSTTTAQRVPLGPSRSQVAPPVANAINARVPLVRARVPAISNHKVPLRTVPPPAVLHEQNEYQEEDANNDMDIDEDVIPDTQREAEAAANLSVIAAEQEVEAMIGVEDSDEEEVNEDADSLPQAKRARVWPEVSEEHAARYLREVDAIRAAFDEELDVNDPSMVSEYAEEIFEYMCELEEDVMPNPDYMDGQNEITWAMRQKLVDWLLQVHLRYHMLPETLWIAVNIVDRFLSKRVVSLPKLQLVGVTAMFIAAKYEEILAPSVDEFVFMTDGGYNKAAILKGEKIVLQTLDFRVSQYCSPYSWMRKISRADDYDIQTRTLSKFLTEVTLLDYRFLRAKPSLVAAVGMYCARKMLGGDWNEAFVFYSGYTEEQLIPGHQLLVDKLTEEHFDRQYVYKKYTQKKFLKASVFATEWAHQHRDDDMWLGQ